MNRSVLPLLAGLILAAIAALPAAATTLAGGRFGEVHVSAPAGRMRGLLMLFSSLGGWQPADQLTADDLAAHGLLVVGVDSANYAATLAATSEACHALYNDVTAISGQLQRERGAEEFFTPIAAGTGDAGPLAVAVLHGAPSNTVAGAVAIDPGSALDPRFKPCPANQLIAQTQGLPGFWAIGTTAPLAPAFATEIASLHQTGTDVETRQFANDTGAAAMLLALVEPHLRPPVGTVAALSLPLVELPAATPGTMLAVVISGDGGWHDLDQTIAKELQDRGVSVVGIDSLKYFWRQKTPEQTARDVNAVIRTYTARWHASSVALIGYSFGADVLPFAFNRLAPQQRDRVDLIALLGFESAADFEIKITGWLGLPPSAAALPVGPEIDRVPAELVQCFYGAKETASFCPSLANRHIAVIRTEGGHHFGSDYRRLAGEILDGWRSRMRARQ